LTRSPRSGDAEVGSVTMHEERRCGRKLTSEKDGVVPCWIVLVVFEVENVDDGCVAPSVIHRFIS
jgi:hypothetical protein